MLSTKYRFYNISDMAPTTDLTSVQTMIERGIPNVLILSGVPGTGKTNLARLLAAHILGLTEQEKRELILKGEKSDTPGYIERDFTRHGRADNVRQLADTMETTNDRSLFGKLASVYVLDEFDSAEKDNQKKLIKAIDDEAHEHTYIIIVTNHLDKLERTITSRAVNHAFQFEEMSKEFATKYIMEISKRESNNSDVKPITAQIAEEIYFACDYAAPRDLILGLQAYYTTGRVPNHVTNDTGVVSSVITAMDDLARAIGKGLDNETKDAASGKLIRAVENLCRVKPSYSAVVAAFGTFYHHHMRQVERLEDLKKIAHTLDILSKKPEMHGNLMYMDVLKNIYLIVEYRAEHGQYRDIRQ